MVFGGSWGATLALIYAQKFPKRVNNLLLRGVFLMTAPELEWFYGGGAGQFWPDVWKKFKDPIPTDEQSDLIKAYNKRLFSGNIREEMEFGQHWSAWENALASIASDGISARAPADYARTFARLENHYFINNGFLDDKDAILSNMDKIEDIPGNIVQGRFDMICPPTSAFKLFEKWPSAKIKIVPQAGHAMSEPGISSELVQITNELVS
jgi:proline iminopeptidase